MSPSPEYSASENDYRIHFRMADDRVAPRRKAPSDRGSRRRSTPAAFNGIHRRRVKRINW